MSTEPENPNLVELDTPTIADTLPTNFKRWGGFSVTNASQDEATLAHITLMGAPFSLL
jgi:hypothetical protein